MKKSKLLALILVIAIMLMGAGYAAWQETLTINSTVSTGELNMEFKSNVVYPILTTFDNIKWPLFKDFFGDSTIVQDIPNDTVTVTINDMYPGSTFNYEFSGDKETDIQGNYSIIAKVSGSIKAEEKGDTTIWQKEFVVLPKKKFKTQNKTLEIKEQVSLKLDEYNEFAKSVTEASKINSI